MIEQIATITITVGSALLFAYWFRYSCVLILNARTARDFASQVVSANQLAFMAVQAELKQGSADLGRLQGMLDRDYAVLRPLIQGGDGIEERLLKIHYRVMGTWARMSRPFSAEMARKALDEMSMVVAHFANSVGERQTCGAAA
jgi:hypothetical protein